jgi:hypothetical protein
MKEPESSMPVRKGRPKFLTRSFIEVDDDDDEFALESSISTRAI